MYKKIRVLETLTNERNSKLEIQKKTSNILLAMITPSEATDIVLQNLFNPKTESCDVHQLAQRVLNEDVLCDFDLPPFHRVMMDGVALRFADLQTGQRTFCIIGMQQAGIAAHTLSEPNSCIEVMTGAICPYGCDAVVPYEQIVIGAGVCTIQNATYARNQNIQLKGTDKTKGEIIVAKKTKMTAVEIAALCAVGRSEVQVLALPRIHIFSTGNELVEIHETPKPYQIRRSNVFVLQQLLVSYGLNATQSHLSDQFETIVSGVKKALENNDVILLSGGVSKGKFDLIPDVMKHLGVENKFHGVAQKPGKPFWFGRLDSKWIFAFPGNPISTYLCAIRYLIPWLNASFSQPEKKIFAKLTEDIAIKGTFTFYLQVQLTFDKNACLCAAPMTSSGSGDFANLASADAFLELPPTARSIKAGAVFRCFPFRNFI